MKRLILLLSLIISTSYMAQTIYYSQASGDPGILSNWNTNRSGGGTSLANFSTNNQHYLIQNSHTMITTSTWAISGGSGVKLQIESGGTLQADFAVDLTTTGTFQIDGGGTYIHNNTGTASTTIFDGTESFATTSSIEIRNWSGTGTSLTTGVTLPFGNLIINWTSNSGNWQWGLSGNVSLCAGAFTLTSTGTGTVILGSGGGPTITIDGNFNISNGTLDFSSGAGATSVVLSKDFNMSGGTITETLSGSGTIAFLGSTTQSYTMSSGTISNKINFTVNNSNGITLNNNLVINGVATLTMTSGNIDLNSNILTIGSGTGSTQVGSLSWTSGFIVGTGTLKRWIQNSTTINIGDVAGLFPFGNSSYNRNVWIGCVTTSSGGGTISIQHSNQTGYTDITQFSDGSISIDRRHNMNWTITTAEGLSGGTNFSIRIQGTGIPSISNVSDLRLIRASDAVGTSQNGTGSTSDPQVNRSGLSAATLSNTFYFGSNSSVNALPVELTSFTSNVIGSKVQLNWRTATEVNNYGFSVQRSAVSGQYNAKNWITLGFVQGNGNSNSPKNYSFIDQPTGGKEFKYRLKQIDFDGAFEYSYEITAILENISAFKLDQNYPNPFNPFTKISYTIPQRAYVHLRVYDMLAKEVAELINTNQEAGRYEVTFDGTNLPSGAYFYKLEAGNYIEVKKFLLVK